MRLKRRLNDEANLLLTPLIDMIFLVVIFFMLNTSLAINPAIQVDLPAAYTSQARLEDEIIVTLNGNGDIYIENTSVTLDRFPAELKKEMIRLQNNRAILRADEALPYKNLIEIMDLASAQPVQFRDKQVILEFMDLDTKQILEPKLTAVAPEHGFESTGGIALPLKIPGPDIRKFESMIEFTVPERIHYDSPTVRQPLEFSENSILPSPEFIISQAQEDAGIISSTGIGPGVLRADELDWTGYDRKLLKRAALNFPEVLLSEGQEVDVEAAFTVAPSGQVIRVEITRSSGYTLVDRAVERALSNYLFGQSASGEKDRGVIKFMFRLKRTD